MEGFTHLFLCLHRTLQVRLNSRSEILHFLLLETLDLASHAFTQVLERESRLVCPPFGIADIRLQLTDTILLSPAALD